MADMLMNAELASQKWAFEIPPEPIPEDKITAEESAELVVVGEGFSGLCTALAAAEEGVDVLVVTGSGGPIGRGGSIFATYSKLMEKLGYERKEPGDFYLEEFASSSFCVDQRKWYRFYNESERAMNWFIDIVEAAGCTVVLEDANDDDESSPTYQPVGTHGIVNSKQTFSGLGINLALKALEEKFKGLGGRVIYKTPARRLVQDDTGRVTGVIAQCGEDFIKINASKGVVLATGDFSMNRDMMAKYCPAYAKYFKSGENDYSKAFAMGGLYAGDGHLMALWAGAAWQRTYPNAALIQGSRLCTHLPYGSHRGIRLNRDGERFMNEDSNGAYTALACLREPGGIVWIIWGDNYADEVKWRPHGGTRQDDYTPAEKIRAQWEELAEKGMILKADTLEEIVEKTGLPIEKTLAEIERYNGFCRDGYDADFHKKPKYLQEIKDAPFYAGRIDDARFFSVFGGPRTDYKMRICNENDEPIPGLYCVGSMVGDMYANCYNFRIAGHNYGTCLTFGYLTGKGIADGSI